MRFGIDGAQTDVMNHPNIMILYLIALALLQVDR